MIVNFLIFLGGLWPTQAHEGLHHWLLPLDVVWVWDISSLLIKQLYWDFVGYVIKIEHFDQSYMFKNDYLIQCHISPSIWHGIKHHFVVVKDQIH